WWSPDGKRIAFTRIDEARVPMQRRFEIQAGDVDIIEQRYPATGTNNVDIRLGVIAVDRSDDAGGIDWIDLGPSTDIYLPHVTWLLYSACMGFRLQRPDPRCLDLIKASLGYDRKRVLLTETSETWINLSHDLRPLADGGFVWSSERDGYRHLYLHG